MLRTLQVRALWDSKSPQFQCLHVLLYADAKWATCTCASFLLQFGSVVRKRLYYVHDDTDSGTSETHETDNAITESGVAEVGSRYVHMYINLHTYILECMCWGQCCVVIIITVSHKGMLYSASAVLRATDCNLIFHDTAAPFSTNTCQCEPFLPSRYLNTCLAALQCNFEV